MIMQAKMFTAMGVWTSLEPQLTTPTTSPSLQRECWAGLCLLDRRGAPRADSGAGAGEFLAEFPPARFMPSALRALRPTRQGARSLLRS
jgi:hypothetical protein